MPHAILRALRHRSTPTLLPSISASQAPEQQDSFLIIPSIFITVPDEEGAHHWCALAGTVTSLSASGSPSFDVPLPDFAALEETIDRLKRAGETPTFRRPGKRVEVVLPKKKYGNTYHYNHQTHHHQHIVHSHSNNGAGPGVGTKRPPRPKRPQTSPTTPQERAQIEIETPSHGYAAGAHAADRVEAMETNATGRFTPTKVFRSLKKQKHRPPPVFTSISYESVVAQPFSPPVQYSSLPRAPTPANGSKRQKRNSLGWLFSSKRASIPVMRQSVEVLGVVAEREDIAPQQQQLWSDDAAMEYDMLACFEEQDFDESPPSPAETHESDLDKPLPPIPAALAEIFPEEVPAVADSLHHATSSEASVAEMQINDSVQVQVVMAMNDAFRDVDFPLSQPRTPPANEATTNISSNTSAVLSDTVEKEKKVKRKFSLKHLRERFLSGPTPTVAQDIPPVPDLPPLILVLPSVSPIDPPFTSLLPIDPPFTPPSFPIDSPFTPPPLPVFVVSQPLPAVSVTRSEERIANAKMIEKTRGDSPSPPPLDEDSNISTSSEDSSGSSAAVSNTLSSPDSTPPDTPGSVRVGPVFGLLQENDAREPKPEVKDSVDPELEVKIAAVDTGITRSAGMRMQLDSLRFNETHMVAVVV